MADNNMAGTLPEEQSQSLTFGQQLVGLDFNPSNNQRVQRVNELCAELADLVHDDSLIRMTSQLYITIHEHALGEILNTQMNVVKLLTLKY